MKRIISGVQGARQQEVVVLVFFIIFGIGWAFLLVPYLGSLPWFYTMAPLPAYLLYNLGWFFIMTAFMGGFVAYLVLGKNRVLTMLKVGLSTWLLYSLVFDNWQPAFYLSPQGQVLLPVGTPALENTAVDAMLASVWGAVVPNEMVTINFALVDGVILAVLGILAYWYMRKGAKGLLMAGAFLGTLAVSFFAFFVFKTAFMVSFSLLYVFVYPVSSVLALIAMALILAPRKFIKAVFEGV